MYVYSAAHINVLIAWLEEQGVNVVTLGNKSKPLVLVSPKEFESAIDRLANRQELEARLVAGEESRG
jgi:Cys-tRNA synthase (O-phospho-L-seryl-tRNA:Cys-tRNA synthase)